MPTSLVATVLLIGIWLLVAIYLFKWVQYRRNADTSLSKQGGANRKKRVLVILGSGGHTSEMLTLLSVLNGDEYEFSFVCADTDKTSTPRVHAWSEQRLKEEEKNATAISTSTQSQSSNVNNNSNNNTTTNSNNVYYIHDYRQCKFYYIPRSREVGQSYFTSIFSTLKAFARTIGIVQQIAPDMVLTNGPGTCIPVCAAAFLSKALGFKRVPITFVESVARVHSLSLSGKLLYHLRLADTIVVQWKPVAQRYPRTIYRGRLI